MTHWLPHVRSRHAPPSDRCSAFQSLHSTQVFEAAPDAEVGEPRLSILCAGMCEGALSHKLQWSTAAWLSCCLSTQDGVMAFMVGEWQCWFCQFLGLPLPSMLALSTNNRKCPCHRPYDAHGDHVSTCCQHLAPRTRAYNHALTCLGSLSNLIGKKLVEIQLSDLPGSRGVSTRGQ